MRRSVIFDVVVGCLFHSALLLSLFLLVSGHNQPGGGFVGGLVAGVAFSLRYYSGGLAVLRRALPLPPWTLLGCGLLLVMSTVVVPLVTGSEALDHGKVDLDLGPFGTAHVSSTLVFDTGVYLIVLGMVQVLLVSLGDVGDVGDAVDPIAGEDGP